MNPRHFFKWTCDDCGEKLMLLWDVIQESYDRGEGFKYMDKGGHVFNIKIEVNE